jgi:hypothetical protein
MREQEAGSFAFALPPSSNLKLKVNIAALSAVAIRPSRLPSQRG